MHLYEFIKLHHIEQIYVSPALTDHLNTVLSNFNTVYIHTNTPTLFYSLYRPIDLNIIQKHYGPKFIYWHNNDCNPDYKNRRDIVKKIKNMNIITHICSSQQTSKYLDLQNIKHIMITISYSSICVDNLNDTLNDSLHDKVNRVYDINSCNTKLQLNDIFDKVWVINMEKDLRKKELMNEKMSLIDIDFDFFSAIDGSQEPYAYEYDIYRHLPYDRDGAHIKEKTNHKRMIPSVGGYGYLKTWSLILKTAISKKLNRILVFDDDVIFDKDFNIKVSQFFHTIGKVWKIITLGVSQHVWSTVNLKNGYYNTPFHTDGSFAIGLDSSIYQELLYEIDKVNCVFDSGPVREIYKCYSDLCYTCYPNIVIADVSTSSIGGKRLITSFAKKVKWTLNNFNYIPYLDILVSVIIPMYNAENTICMCLDSLLNQTYRHLEIIVVNDCSTDTSVQKVDAYCNKYVNNVFLYHTNENGGCYKARNLGIAHTKGKYIAIQDADDISLPTRIEKQVQQFIENDIIICGCNFIRAHEPFTLQNINKIIEQTKKYKTCIPRFGLVTLMFDKTVFDTYGTFRDDFYHSMDEEYCNRLYINLYGHLSKKHIHTLLSSNNIDNKDFYRKIDQLLYASTPMTNTNISSRYDKNIRNKVRNIVLNDLLNK